jgi:hypothetical protein
LGIFSIQIEDRLETALFGTRNSTNAALANACLQQWENALDSYKKWEANRLEAVIVSGSIGMGSDPNSSVIAKFSNDFLGAPLEQPLSPMDLTKDYFSAQLPVNPNAFAGVVMSRSPLTCDVNVDPGNPAVATIVDSGTLLPKYLPPLPRVTATATKPFAFRNWWITAKSWPRGLLVGAAAFFSSLVLLPMWRTARRKRRLRACLASSGTLLVNSTTLAGSSDTFVISSSFSGSAQDEPRRVAGQPLILIDSPGKTETRAPAFKALHKDVLEDRSLQEQLTLWLKQKLVRRLISDRAELNSQQQATLRVMAVDERLSRIETHLQQQNHIYELRIEELNRELLASKQENRALIHAKIAQVKAEMEAAKARVMAQARDLS